jgi:formylmethanofuran dehydrogenase subunit E
MMRSLQSFGVLLVFLGCVAWLAGCSGQQAEATAACQTCGNEVAKSDVTVVGDKMLCRGCAAQAATAEPEGGLYTCAKCGMKMAKVDMVEQAGKMVCAHCVPATGEQTPTGETEEMVACSMCGGEVPRSEAVFVDGVLLCAHCVPEAHDKAADQDKGGS